MWRVGKRAARRGVVPLAPLYLAPAYLAGLSLVGAGLLLAACSGGDGAAA
jgi:hypothetical protein